MRKSIPISIGLLAASALAIVAMPVVAEPTNGSTAQNFKAIGVGGTPVELAQFRGKTVVLEWNNPGCPFVKKHYSSGNMQRTQAAAMKQGVVWLTINSGAPGQQGYMTVPEAKKFLADAGSSPTDYLLDPKGRIGHAYGAKVTPHMYIIDANGKLVYQGGIDDKPTADTGDIASAHNYVLAALGEIEAGKAVSIAETRPYGCSVKYES
jgi:hypothetical protein